MMVCGSLDFITVNLFQKDLRCRIELEKFAQSSFNYKCILPLSIADLTEDEKKLFTPEYKAESIRRMTTVQLVDIIMCRPTVLFQRQDGHIVSNSVEMSPLTNLTFTRDQQITTAKGVVMGNMAVSQRVCLKLYSFVFIYFFNSLLR
jgi:arginine deiminase